MTMFCFQDKLPIRDLGNGVLLKVLGSGKNINVRHWDMADKSRVTTHSHPEEQFGYVIKGGFNMRIGDETADLGPGDCYFIPSNVPHEFTALGQTEAIDAFSPVRPDLPGTGTQTNKK
jgi:quercetin dioxygenase-like cupin family protein